MKSGGIPRLQTLPILEEPEMGPKLFEKVKTLKINRGAIQDHLFFVSEKERKSERCL